MATFLFLLDLIGIEMLKTKKKQDGMRIQEIPRFRNNLRRFFYLEKLAQKNSLLFYRVCLEYINHSRTRLTIASKLSLQFVGVFFCVVTTRDSRV